MKLLMQKPSESGWFVFGGRGIPRPYRSRLRGDCRDIIYDVQRPIRIYTAVLLTMILLFAAALPMLAQDESAVTDDEVNAVAERLYCPVCENIPLDTCETAACIEWRDEIRTQLAAGYSDEEVIDDFVNRYGERVIGTPRDPFLRGLSIYTPMALGVIALAVAGFSLLRWWNNRARPVSAPTMPNPNGSVGLSEDDYRARLEEDLKSIR